MLFQSGNITNAQSIEPVREAQWRGRNGWHSSATEACNSFNPDYFPGDARENDYGYPTSVDCEDPASNYSVLTQVSCGDRVPGGYPYQYVGGFDGGVCVYPTYWEQLSADTSLPDEGYTDTPLAGKKKIPCPRRIKPLCDAAEAIKNARKANPPKAESPIWKNLKNYRNELKTNGRTGKNLRYYEWDYRHNEIEVFDGSGKHLGAINPTTGKPVPNSIEIGRSIAKKL